MRPFPISIGQMLMSWQEQEPGHSFAYLHVRVVVVGGKDCSVKRTRLVDVRDEGHTYAKCTLLTLSIYSPSGVHTHTEHLGSVCIRRGDYLQPRPLWSTQVS